MKKILLIVFVISSITCFSQDFEKEDKLFGGSFSFSVFNVNSSGPGYYNTGNVGLLPSYSWVVKKNIALGIKGNISYSRVVTTQSATDKNISTSFIIGPTVFLKKYKALKEKFGIYFEHAVGVRYSFDKLKNPSLPDHIKSHTYAANYQFNPGVFYRFSNRFIGEGNIGGVYASYYRNGNNDTFGIAASFLQSFNLGINYVIGKNKS